MSAYRVLADQLLERGLQQRPVVWQVLSAAIAWVRWCDGDGDGCLEGDGAGLGWGGGEGWGYDEGGGDGSGSGDGGHLYTDGRGRQDLYGDGDGSPPGSPENGGEG